MYIPAAGMYDNCVGYMGYCDMMMLSIYCDDSSDATRSFTIVQIIVTGKNVNYHRLIVQCSMLDSGLTALRKITALQVHNFFQTYPLKPWDTMRVLYQFGFWFLWSGRWDVDGSECWDQLMRDRGAVSRESRDHWPAADRDQVSKSVTNTSDHRVSVKTPVIYLWNEH